MATDARETTALIGSDKVEGTDVYNARGEHMGSIERVMIDKRRARSPSRPQFWRLPRHWQRLLSGPLGCPDV